ncbi:MFS transporter [Actinopolymorpha pittospori]
MRSRTDPDQPAASLPAGGATGRGTVLVVSAALTLVVVLATLDQTMVASVWPVVLADLRGGSGSWVVTASLLSSVVVMPIYGKLGDLVGRKQTLQFALAVFLIGAYLSAESGTMGEFVSARVIQGIGTGGLLTGAWMLLADLVPSGRRGRYLGVVGSAYGVSAVLGPLLGGLATEQGSWRWCFQLDLVIGAVALLALSVALRSPRPGSGRGFDVRGTLLLAGVSTCAVLAATGGRADDPRDPTVVLGLVAGVVVLLAAFVVVEKYAVEPAVPLRLFRDPAFTTACLLGLVTGVVVFGALAYVPTYLRVVHGATLAGAGLLMLPMAAGVVVGSVLAGFVAPATPRSRVVPVVGALVAAGGLALLSLSPVGAAREALALAALGGGVGLVVTGLVLKTQLSAPPEDVGVATSVLGYVVQVGGLVGTATLGALLGERVTAYLADQEGPAVPDAEGDVVDHLTVLTPELLNASLPELPTGVAAALAEALPPLLGYGVPVLAAGCLLLSLLGDRRRAVRSAVSATSSSAYATEPVTTEPAVPERVATEPVTTEPVATEETAEGAVPGPGRPGQPG